MIVYILINKTNRQNSTNKSYVNSQKENEVCAFMDNNSGKKKGMAVLSNLAQGAVIIGKKAAEGAKTGVTAIVEKAKADELARKLRKLNPLFPEQYKADTFTRPNIIIIVDDAVRKGVELCEGAIGWLSKENDSEVLYLYDEAVEFSNVQFVPSAVCDSVYYVDQFDRNRYVRTDCIFDKAQEEKVAELEHIAFCLGAKRCAIDIEESVSDAKEKKPATNAEGKMGNYSITGKAESEEEQKSGRKTHIHNEVVFSGFRKVKQPTLKWFAYDEGIKTLIDICCSGKRKIKSKKLEFFGSSFATMSQKTAGTLDCVMKGGAAAGMGISMSAKAKKEHRSKLVLHLEF